MKPSKKSSEKKDSTCKLVYTERETDTKNGKFDVKIERDADRYRKDHEEELKRQKNWFQEP